MFKKYTKLSIFGRLILVVVLIIVIAVMVADTGKPPADIRPLLTAHGSEILAVRDWMQKNDISAIKLLNKSNQNSGKGVSVQTGKLTCYFEGAGTDALFSTASMDKMTEAMSKAFDLDKAAESYGAYAYIRHQDIFEVLVSDNPVYRMGGFEGTSAYYSELPPGELDTKTEIGVTTLVNLNNGWFLADTSKQPAGSIPVNTHSDLFMIIVIIIAVLMISLIISLLYKRFGCNAEVIAMNTEYRGNKTRLQNMIDGAYASIFEKFTVYKIKFLTEENETLEMYVPELEYNRLYEKAHGYLQYKRLGGRCKYTSFTINVE